MADSPPQIPPPLELMNGNWSLQPDIKMGWMPSFAGLCCIPLYFYAEEEDE